MSNLKEVFEKEIVPKLKSELGLKNDQAVPRLEKIVLNIGSSDIGNDKEKDLIVSELEAIAGQKPAITTARKAISSFKIRQGQPIGLKVTLRANRMYDFLNRLVSVVLPRVRDFRGISNKSFDGRGGYSLGFKDQVVFPEIDTSKITKYRGLEITIVTTAKNREQTKRLLDLFGLPFKKEEK